MVNLRYWYFEHDHRVCWYFDRAVGILKWWIWGLVLWTFSVGILKRRYWYFDSACWYYDKVLCYFDRVCWYFDRVCWYFYSFSNIKNLPCQTLVNRLKQILAALNSRIWNLAGDIERLKKLKQQIVSLKQQLTAQNSCPQIEPMINMYKQRSEV